MPLYVTMTPAKTRPEGVSAADFDAIKKGGDIRVEAITARENLRNSRGAYVIKPDAVPVEIKTGIDLNIENMSVTELKTIVLSAGKRIGKKKIKISDLRELARRCIEESADVVGDDDEVDGDDDES